MANIIGQRIPIPQIAAPQAAQAQLLSVPADAPSPAGTLGGLFKSMAAPFMDTASADYKRAETLQALARTQQINQGVTGTQEYSDAIKAGADPASAAVIAAAARGGISAANAGGYNRVLAYGNQANPLGGEALARASLGAGDAFSGTAMGTREAEANRLAMQQRASEIAAAAQIRGEELRQSGETHRAGLTPMEGITPEDQMAFASRADVLSGKVPLRPATMLLEQTKEAARAKAQENAARIAAEAEVTKAGFKMEAGTENGQPSYASVADIVAGRRPNFRPNRSLDQVKADWLVGQLSPAAPAAPATTLDVNAIPTGAPAVRPPMSTDARAMIGLPHAPQTFINKQTNEVATSRDGGQTGITTDGRPVNDLQTEGFAVAGPESGLTEVGNAMAKRQAMAPSPYVNRDPAKGDIAQAALIAAGLPAAVRSHINALVGSVTGGALPELDPATERARQTLAIFDQTIKPALLNSAGKGLKEQAIVQSMLPTGSAFESPETVARNSMQIHAYLLQQNKLIRSGIQTATNPAMMQDYQQRLAENEAALEAITHISAGAPKTAPAKAAPPPAAVAPAAPAASGKLPPGITAEQAITDAQEAIARTPSSKAAVLERLKGFGIDPAAVTVGPAASGGTF